jgi:hypothetical protein
MKRLRRWAFRGFAIVSAFLCAALIFFRSADHFSGEDQADIPSRELTVVVPGRTIGLFLIDGHLFVLAGSQQVSWRNWNLDYHLDSSWGGGIYCFAFIYNIKPELLWLHLGDFGATVYHGRPANELFRGAIIVMTPPWFAIMLFAIPPALVIFGFIRRPRKSSGHATDFRQFRF